MTVNGFINNLEGTNDGDNFPKETLKALYQSIKSKPLEWATDEEDEQKEERPQQKPGNGTMTLHSNPFVEVRFLRLLTECIILIGFVIFVATFIHLHILDYCNFSNTVR